MAHPDSSQIVPQPATDLKPLFQAPAPDKKSLHIRHQKAAIRHSEAEWEAIKAEVYDLVINQNLRPLEIENHFSKKDPPFVANKRQWERRLSKWELRTNVPKDKKTQMLIVKEKRQKVQGKKTEFRYKKRKVEINKLDRFARDESLEMESLQSMPTPETISDVTAFTPRDSATPDDPHTPTTQISAPFSGLEPAVSSPYFPNVASPSPAPSNLNINTEDSVRGRSLALLEVSSAYTETLDSQSPRRPGAYSPQDKLVNDSPVTIRSSSIAVSTPNLFSHTLCEETSRLDSIPNALHQHQEQSSSSGTQRLNLARTSQRSPVGGRPPYRYRQKDEEDLRQELMKAEQRGIDRIENLPIMEELQEILRFQGRFKSSELYANRIIKIYKRYYANGVEPLEAMLSLGALLIDQGRYAEAETYIRPVVQKLEVNAEFRNDRALYHGYDVLSWALEVIGDRHGECELLKRRMLSLGMKIYGVGSFENYLDRGFLAKTLSDQGMVDLALVDLREVLSGLRSVPDKNVVLYRVIMTCYLVEALRKTGSLREALSVCVEGRGTAKRFLGAEHPNTLLCEFEEALIYLSQGSTVQGRKLLESVLKVQTKILGEHHPDTEITRKKLREVEVTRQEGYYSRSLPLMEAVEGVIEGGNYGNNPQVSEVKTGSVMII